MNVAAFKELCDEVIECQMMSQGAAE